MSTERTMDERDPFAPIETSPRGASTMVVLALVLAVFAAIGGLAPIAGPAAMLLALAAHVKGQPYGMPVAVISGIAMIVGMIFTLYLR